MRQPTQLPSPLTLSDASPLRRWLPQVRRLLRLLKGLQVERRARGLQVALHAARQPGALPTGVLLAYG